MHKEINKSYPQSETVTICSSDSLSHSAIDRQYALPYTKTMNFTAIDFETATGYRNSACAVAIITVEKGTITDQYYQLIQPPGNAYWRKNIAIHGVHPSDTANAPTFADYFPEIGKRLKGKTIVAHNESFDRSVLRHTMEHYGLSYCDLDLPDPWECTVKIYRAKGFNPVNLAACCERLSIPLNHHNALSDALACAELYIHHVGAN